MADTAKTLSQQWELAQQAKPRAPEPPAKEMGGTSGEFNRAHDNQQKPQVIPMKPLTRSGAQPVPGLKLNPPTLNRGLSQEPLNKLHQDVKARNDALQKDSAKPHNPLDLEHGNKDRDDRGM